MANSVVREHRFPKKRFQAATIGAIDQHAGVIQSLAERQQAQGEIMADLCVARDEAQKRWLDLAAVIDQAGWAVAQCKDHGRTLDNLGQSVLHRHEAIVANHSEFLDFTRRSFWQRLRWLVTGR